MKIICFGPCTLGQINSDNGVLAFKESRKTHTKSMILSMHRKVRKWKMQYDKSFKEEARKFSNEI